MPVAVEILQPLTNWGVLGVTAGSRADHKKFVYNFEPNIYLTVRLTLHSQGKLVQKFIT